MSQMVVYVTASSREEALGIARTVVGERLAACANVSADVRSVYWWEGRLSEDAEAALILKTTPALMPALIDRIRELHSYACPGIVAWPIAAGNPDFLAWITAETAGPQG